VGVIDRVHRNASYSRADAPPTNRASLTKLAQVVLLVADFTNRRAALNMNPANFT
jgi:hypothetical protein